MSADEQRSAEAKEREESRSERADEDKVGARVQGALSDMIKRTFYAGLGAVFTTEEGIRRMVSEFSLPKDVASFLISQVQTTQEQLFRIVAGELHGWLEKLNIHQELSKFLTTVSLEVKTQVRFIPNDQALVKPEIKQKVSIRRASKAAKEPAPAAATPQEPTEAAEETVPVPPASATTTGQS